jgi:hypothetical protein
MRALLARVERRSLWFSAMAGDMRRRGVHIDADGVRTEQRSRVHAGTWLILAAIGAVGVLMLLALSRSAPR